MPTSTLQQYALDGSNYVWDSVTGILFTAGILKFFVVMLIIFGVIAVGITLIRRIFKV